MKDYKCWHIRRLDRHIQPDTAYSTAFESFMAIYLCDKCAVTLTVAEVQKRLKPGKATKRLPSSGRLQP